ncbi:MAG: Topoisomerase 1-associated factor 1 [Claussenomyces sp. TS43310]|nr:MAG: Topoisomerase 1-associated factor 1 [Claussenomyces sp. TS43310]
MDLSNGSREVVDPEVRAYVSSLVTALGGNGADEDGRYILGDDALACLRDLKRWLKLYDEKANRMDVARCLAESNLINGDLLQILAAWPENATEDKIKSKTALACLELLVPLTWPIERNREMTVNHHRHTPFLQLAQLGYKRSIINFDGARILHTAVRVALPSMAQPSSERSSRDQGIIKLVLYFLRNIAMIAPPSNIEYDGDEAEISRSATIDAFDYQDIFHLLLTMSSTMGEDFNLQDVIVLEVIFHLIRGVDVEKLFLDEAQLDTRKVDDLVALRNQEAGMQRGYARSAPTRHNRFGTMLWIQRDDHKMSTVSGQEALIDGAKSLARMDKAKKFKPPRRAVKDEGGLLDFGTPVSLNFQANKHLRSFVEDFLDSGFNPLFLHIRKAIDREADRVLEYHPRQFFYLVSWFLEAERFRRKTKKSSKSKSRKHSVSEETDTFSLVASVLNQEMFITLNRAMESAYENKAWQDLNAAMRCFTQILLTVQEMFESTLEEDQEIAENILSRIFYEETTHDRVANITRYYKDQGFGYLDACTELTHNYLRILENYSKQNTELVVRSKRRTRRKKKAAREAGEGMDDEHLDESEGEDDARAARISQERKFDFQRFATRFLSQGCIDTFVTFCKFYNDLKPEQLKRAHRFFYRVAFKHDMSVMLFRVDIIALLHKMIKGPEGLDPMSSSFKEWDEMFRQLMKRCTRKIRERPELIVEMLFSKTSATAQFLKFGYTKQTVSSRPRAAAELEVKGALPWEEQVGIAVSVLLDRNQGDHLEWLKSQLASSATERKGWEEKTIVPASTTDVFAGEEQAAQGDAVMTPSIVLKSDNEALRVALFKNGHLRLLLSLLGFQKVDSEDEASTSWIIPSSMSATQLRSAIDLIKRHEFSPPIFDDGAIAEDQIRRKPAASQQRKAFDDSDGGLDDSGEEFLFAPGGPTATKSSAAASVARKRLRRKRRSSASGDDDDVDADLDPEVDEERRRARRARELEKLRRLKSEVYVHDSDDESDAERDRLFFEQEEKLRQRSRVEALKELLRVGGQNPAAAEAFPPPPPPSVLKRKMMGAFVDSESGSEDDDDADRVPATWLSPPSPESSLASRHEATPPSDPLALDSATPASTPQILASRRKRRRVSHAEVSEDEPVALGGESQLGGRKRGAEGIEDVEDEDEDEGPISRPIRRRTRVTGAFVESSEEE